MYAAADTHTRTATSFACDRNTKNENCINYGKHLSLIGLIIIDVCTNRGTKQEPREKEDEREGLEWTVKINKRFEACEIHQYERMNIAYFV